jgi:predicted alpha/beta superfamily hydrolase
MKAFSLLTLLVLTSLSVNGQDTVLQVRYTGHLDSIHSKILNQRRLIQVFTPSGYQPGSNEKYDVLYVLDGGNWNTGLIERTQRFIEGEGFMPPTLIVSVMGIDRNQELTPTHLDDWKYSGGGKDFLAFIKNELIPHIDRNYPSNGENTLWGHSLSGMFAVYALLSEPTLFRSVIAADPSIWWDKSLVAKMAATELDKLKGKNTTLYVSAREGETMTGMKIDTLEAVLKKHAPADMAWKIVAYPEETHSSIRLKTTYDGLKFTYAGLTNVLEFHPMNGIVLKDKPIDLWYFEDTTRVRYTVDGSIPKISSSKVQPSVTLTGGAKVTYRKFTRRSAHDRMTVGNFVVGEPLKPIAKLKDVTSGGLSYTYYEGDWQSFPDIATLSATKAGLTSSGDFDIDKLPRKKNYVLVVNGFFESKEEGYYMILLDADKDTRLYIGNQQLIQWNGNYQSRTASFMVPLKKGFYPLRIEYLHKNEDFKLKMSYLTPTSMSAKDPQPIPAALQYHRK